VEQPDKAAPTSFYRIIAYGQKDSERHTRALLALPAGLCNRWVLVAPGGRQQEGTVRQMR